MSKDNKRVFACGRMAGSLHHQLESAPEFDTPLCSSCFSKKRELWTLPVNFQFHFARLCMSNSTFLFEVWTHSMSVTLFFACAWKHSCRGPRLASDSPKIGRSLLQSTLDRSEWDGKHCAADRVNKSDSWKESPQMFESTLSDLHVVELHMHSECEFPEFTGS